MDNLFQAIIEYLSKKGKVEVIGLIIFLVFFPIYVVEFIYFPEWFYNIEITKMTILNIGILAINYVIQVIAYMGTNMIFTKKGKTDIQILGIPVIVLGVEIFCICLGRVFTTNFGVMFIIGFVISIVLDVAIYIIDEKNIRLLEDNI